MQRPGPPQPFSQRLTFQVFHHHVRPAVRLDSAVEDVHDSGVSDPRRGARLVEEALERVLIPNQLRRQELDRDPALEALMFRQEDHPHRPASKLGDDSVIAECVANHSNASAQNVVSPP